MITKSHAFLAILAQPGHQFLRDHVWPQTIETYKQKFYRGWRRFFIQLKVNRPLKHELRIYKIVPFRLI